MRKAHFCFFLTLLLSFDDELVEAVAGYWTEAGLVVDLQTPEFGAYLDVLFDRENRADAIFVSSSKIRQAAYMSATAVASGRCC